MQAVTRDFPDRSPSRTAILEMQADPEPPVLENQVYCQSILRALGEIKDPIAVSQHLVLSPSRVPDRSSDWRGNWGLVIFNSAS